MRHSLQVSFPLPQPPTPTPAPEPESFLAGYMRHYNDDALKSGYLIWFRFGNVFYLVATPILSTYQKDFVSQAVTPPKSYKHRSTCCSLREYLSAF